MAQAFQAALGNPYRSSIIIGTDIPGIMVSMLSTAFKSLEKHDVVIGPTEDGGYYLIGLKKDVPELFENIAWSTNTVFSATREKAHALGLSLKVLPKLRDLDTEEDLHVFIQDSKHQKNQTFSGRTKRVLQELEKRLAIR